MDSVTFCGQTCHTVMQPEFTAYQNSPHSRVECVKCHIGPGAAWFVQSKLSGVGQVFAVTFNTYPRPIPTPVHNLRPARETCEACHWPQKYGEDRLRVIHKFADDETNTPDQDRAADEDRRRQPRHRHSRHASGAGRQDPLRRHRRGAPDHSVGGIQRSRPARRSTPPPTPSPTAAARRCARWIAWTATTVRRTAYDLPERGVDKAMAAGAISTDAALRQEEGRRDPEGQLHEPRRGRAEDSGGVRQVLPGQLTRRSTPSGRRKSRPPPRRCWPFAIAISSRR